MDFDDHAKRAFWVMMGLLPAFFFSSGIDLLLTNYFNVETNIRIILYLGVSFVFMMYFYGYGHKKKIRT